MDEQFYTMAVGFLDGRYSNNVAVIQFLEPVKLIVKYEENGKPNPPATFLQQEAYFYKFD